MSVLSIANCASGSDIKIYAIDPSQGLIRDGETLIIEELKCSEAEGCPYAAVSFEDLRTLLELLESCEEDQY